MENSWVCGADAAKSTVLQASCIIACGTSTGFWEPNQCVESLFYQEKTVFEVERWTREHVCKKQWQREQSLLCKSECFIQRSCRVILCAIQKTAYMVRHEKTYTEYTIKKLHSTDESQKKLILIAEFSFNFDGETLLISSLTSESSWLDW